MEYAKIEVKFHVPEDWDESNEQELSDKVDEFIRQIEYVTSHIKGFSGITISDE